MSLRVLIVEDELMLADILEEALLDHGYDVAGIATNIHEANTLMYGSATPDVAIIDVRLADGDDGGLLGSSLMAQSNIAVLYASGNVGPDVSVCGHAYIPKPYSLRDICRAVEVTVERVRTGTISGDLPPSLVLLPFANSQALPPSTTNTSAQDGHSKTKT